MRPFRRWRAPCSPRTGDAALRLYGIDGWDRAIGTPCARAQSRNDPACAPRDVASLDVKRLGDLLVRRASEHHGGDVHGRPVPQATGERAQCAAAAATASCAALACDATAIGSALHPGATAAQQESHQTARRVTQGDRPARHGISWRRRAAGARVATEHATWAASSSAELSGRPACHGRGWTA
jgi:hypothetical protein